MVDAKRFFYWIGGWESADDLAEDDAGMAEA